MKSFSIRNLTKKDLCAIFGLMSLSGKTIYYYKLRDQYFTDEVLSRLNIPLEEYENKTGGNPFNYHQTMSIVEEFNIEEEELFAFRRLKVA